MVKAYLLLVAVGLAVLANNADANIVKLKNAHAKGAIASVDDDHTKQLVDYYDCSARADGNYVHPWDCTKFMSCVAKQHAYERNCADCHINPADCPTGRLHYDYAQDACDWSHIAGCVADPGTTSEPIEEPVTEPQDDGACDPDDCFVTGYCHDYEWCERDDSDHKGTGKKGTKKTGTCDASQNLYFNPKRNEIHGGVCDFWENLDKDTKDTYNNDPNCIDPHCEWKPDQEKECSSKYWYFHPEQNNGQDKEMHCPSRPDGESLVWDQARKSCHPCHTVNDSTGNPCC